jgi:hypothetical protein
MYGLGLTDGPLAELYRITTRTVAFIKTDTVLAAA